MIDIIKVTEESYGEQCALIGIDYLDFVKSSSVKEYDAVRENMNAIKTQIARGLSVPVIVLAQTNRDNKEADSEVGMRSGKGGTGLESASDFMIGLWRDDKDDVCGRITKHRRIASEYTGYSHPYIRLHIDKGTYKITQMALAEKPVKKSKKELERQEWIDN
jgi:hypothetical protein